MEIKYARILMPGKTKLFKYVEKGAEEVYQIEDTDGLVVSFLSISNWAGRRYKHLYIKEPETIEWLRRLSPEDVLWDVGANVGIYTIYAGLVKRCRVIAIEPGAANYFTLNANIEMNGLERMVDAYCVALGDEHKCADLFLSSTMAGSAQNALDRPLTDTGKEFIPAFRQAMLSVPADVLVKLGAPVPTAIKIDVDGFEIHVLSGAKEVLRDDRLRRVSLEMNSKDSKLVNMAEDILTEAGFKRVAEHRSNYVPNSPIHNYHFEKI